MWYNISMRISEPKQNYRTIKCVHILIMTILYIALINAMLKNKKRKEDNHGVREQKQYAVICIDATDGYRSQ